MDRELLEAGPEVRPGDGEGVPMPSLRLVSTRPPPGRARGSSVAVNVGTAWIRSDVARRFDAGGVQPATGQDHCRHRGDERRHQRQQHRFPGTGWTNRFEAEVKIHPVAAGRLLEGDAVFVDLAAWRELARRLAHDLDTYGSRTGERYLRDLRMRRHHDARPGAVNAGLPGARRINPAAAVVGGALAHVPDVALLVLGKVINGVLGQQSRSAVKAMQIKYGLPADSWPTAELLARMRAALAACRVAGEIATTRAGPSQRCCRWVRSSGCLLKAAVPATRSPINMISH